MEKYCYLTRDTGKFKAVNINKLNDLDYIDDCFIDEGISIGIIKGKNLQEIENKAKNKLKQIFKNLKI